MAKKLQSGKDWLLRGMEMALMPFTNRARAWEGFKKEVLTMKGGGSILLMVAVALGVHYVDSCSSTSKPPSQNLSISNNTKTPIAVIGESSNVVVRQNAKDMVSGNISGSAPIQGDNNNVKINSENSSGNFSNSGNIAILGTRTADLSNSLPGGAVEPQGNKSPVTQISQVTGSVVKVGSENPTFNISGGNNQIGGANNVLNVNPTYFSTNIFYQNSDKNVPKPFIFATTLDSLNSTDSVDGFPAYKTKFSVIVCNPVDVSFHITSIAALVSKPTVVLASGGGLEFDGNQTYSSHVYIITFFTPDKVKESDFHISLNPPKN